MNTMQITRLQFESTELWGRITFPEATRARLSAALIPQDTSSVLDIGCGDGRITNLLSPSERFVVGCDISRTALLNVHAHRVRASIDRLPFKNSSFDAVTIFEMLEHLPHDTLLLGLSEVKRIALKYVLISVPYCERRWSQAVRCAQCGQVYNAYGHLQSFSMKRLYRLLMPEFYCITLVSLSVHGHHFGAVPNCLYWIAKRVGGVWSPLGHALCPRCAANEKRLSKGNIVGFLITRLIWRLETQARYRPTWVLALYERRA